MAEILLKGEKIHTVGTLPNIGSQAPQFSLVNKELSEKSIDVFLDKKIVLNIFPSIDTGVCAMSVRKFNSEAANFNDAYVLCISADLPFAQSRFCGAEGITNVIMLSDFRNKEFGTDYGVRIEDGPLAGLLSRAVLIINQDRKVIYTEQVPEIGQEPDYNEVLLILTS